MFLRPFPRASLIPRETLDERPLLPAVTAGASAVASHFSSAGDFAAATEALTTTRELLTRAARTTRERARGRGLALYVLRAERLAAMALAASDAMRATTR